MVTNRRDSFLLAQHRGGYSADDQRPRPEDERSSADQSQPQETVLLQFVVNECLEFQGLSVIRFLVQDGVDEFFRFLVILQFGISEREIVNVVSLLFLASFRVDVFEEDDSFSNVARFPTANEDPSILELNL